jgi:hypothetical protein
MALNLVNLDERTRKLMLAEYDADAASGRLYLSRRFSDEGKKQYPGLLKSAIQEGNDETLALALAKTGFWKTTEKRVGRTGQVTYPKVPATASQTFVEGEFNRFYIRGLCLRAIEDQIAQLVIYRAKEVAQPRRESEARIGKKLPAERLLDDLRRNIGVDTALGVPPGPNSGLSVKLP